MGTTAGPLLGSAVVFALPSPALMRAVGGAIDTSDTSRITSGSLTVCIRIPGTVGENSGRKPRSRIALRAMPRRRS